MDRLLEFLVENGITIRVSKPSHSKYGILYDLDPRTKSHMHIYDLGDVYRVEQRYDKVTFIDKSRSLDEQIDHLMELLVAGMHGRPFMDITWKLLYLNVTGIDLFDKTRENEKYYVRSQIKPIGDKEHDKEK